MNRLDRARLDLRVAQALAVEVRARRDFRDAQRALARHPGPLGRMAFIAAQDRLTAAHQATMRADDRRREGNR